MPSPRRSGDVRTGAPGAAYGRVVVDPPPLIRPVEGPVASRFSYDRRAPFRRGGRRVVRFAVPSGTAVRAPCTGRVTHAGPTPGGPAVTLRCGAWSVTLTGVASAGARRGRATRTGRTVGRARTGTTIARTRAATPERRVRTATIGLGVRRASDPFGYVDPLPLLRDPGPARRFVPLGPAPRTRPVAPVPAPVSRVPSPVLRPWSAPAMVPVQQPKIPWIAWVGLALAALGVPAGTVALRIRRPLGRSALTQARHPSA